MRRINSKWQLWLFIILLSIIGLTGGVNLSLRKSFHLAFEQLGKDVIITSVNPANPVGEAYLRPGDKLLAMDSYTIEGADQALWLSEKLESQHQAIFMVEREGARLQFTVKPTTHFTLFNLLLVIILGIFTISSGFLVGWVGKPDKTALAYAKAWTAAGFVNLLQDYENVFHSPVLHYAYVFFWLVCYDYLFIGLIEFTSRFTRTHLYPRLKELQYNLLYIPFSLLLILLSYSFYQAYFNTQIHWIRLWNMLFYNVFSPILLLSYIISLCMFSYRHRHPANIAEKDRLLWIIIILSIGFGPFFLLYKAPGMLGLSPIIPLWVSEIFLFIVPVGWGMAVASFRMFKLEWVFSRTVIYFITIALVFFLIAAFAMIGMNYFGHPNTLSLIFLVVIGLVVGYSALAGLINQVKNMIDRIYYHDWYNYRLEMSHLTVELSQSMHEDKFRSLLTERLPAILQIEYATLLELTDGGQWEIFSLSDHLTPERKAILLREIAALSEKFSLKSSYDRFELSKTSLEQTGYSYLLPLRHADKLVGALILGQKHSGAPFSEQDHNLLASFSVQAAVAMENINMQKELLTAELEKHKGLYREKELERARVLQQSLLPQAELNHGCYRISSLSKTATEVGGDYYDFFPLSDGKLVIVIGDVSGHGMSSGLLMAMVKSSLYSIMNYQPPITAVLETVNQVVRTGGASQKMFLTFCILLFDPAEQTVTCSVNGHPLPLLLSKDGVVSEFGVSSYPLGIRKHPACQVKTYPLNAGDKILLVTDGLPELQNEQQEVWGYANLQACLANLAHLHGMDLLESLLSAAYACAGNHPQDDDIALVSVEMR